jgi:cell division septation protein DedD
MTDYSRDRLGPDDEDRLPWLEPVEEEPEEGRTFSSRLIVGLAALLLIAIVAGIVLWLRSGDKATTGEGALIKAPDAYYKERPAPQAPGTAEDEIVYSASKGNEVESEIDTSSTAETPINVDRAAAPAAAAPTAKPAVPAPTVTRNAPPAAKPTAPPVAATTAPVPTKPVVEKPRPKPAAPKPAAAAERPVSGGSTIQLGAFSTQAKANAAWKTLSGRFSFLAGLTQSVVPVQSGDKTLYRLRASGGGAGDICARLRTAGESCSVIG